MKISYNWLGSYFFDTSKPKLEDVVHGLTFHAFEIDSVEKHQEDTVLDVKVTPNRGHDCLAHRAIAKEVAAIADVALREDPLRRPVLLLPKTDKVSITIQDQALCSRYIAVYLRGVKVGPSPAWLKKRLEVIGQRSINNVVDATNYVMFSLGQPLHAFDAGKLSISRGPTSVTVTEVGPRYAIEVRKARVGEKMVALDDKEYALTDSMLVIADGNSGATIGIAGVKGGEPAGISDTTTDIIIESANFNAASVRKTAQALKLRTDASTRFEQVLSPELAAHGIESVVTLIRELAGGELVGYADQFPKPISPWTVSVSEKGINALLGTKISIDEIGKALNRLGLTHTVRDGVFTVQVPFERLDIQIPEDLVEEVGRIIGYDAVPTTELPPMQGSPALNKKFYWSEKIREFLISQGFSEVYTSVFSHKGERQVLNKVGGEKPFLRATIATGLKDALDRNIRNKELLGLDAVRIFEIGDVWHGGEEYPALAIAVEPAKKEKKTSEYLALLYEAFGISTAPTVDKNANVVEIKLDELLSQVPHPAAYEKLALSNTTRYQSFSRYPYIVRDIALWTPSGTQPDDIEKMIREHSGELLQRADLFDQFEKDGKVSFAFRLVFQSFDRTLMDLDANERMESIYLALKNKGYEIR